MKTYATIYFNDNYDVDAVELIIKDFDEAEIWYHEKVVRFRGEPEQLQELARAIRTVETIKEIK